MVEEVQNTWDKITEEEAQEKAKIYDSEYRFCPLYGGYCKDGCPANRLSEIFLNKLTQSYEVKKGGCTAYALKGPVRD